MLCYVMQAYLLVLGSYTRTDTNDLAGGARRGKGAMVTSHTSFVLKVVVVVVKVRLSQTHSTIYSTAPSYACISTYASRPPSRSHREPQHPDEPRRSVRRARLLRRARPAACVSSTASAAVVACLPRLLLVSPATTASAAALGERGAQPRETPSSTHGPYMRVHARACFQPATVLGAARRRRRPQHAALPP